MSDFFNTKNSSRTARRMIGRQRWNSSAYNSPLGPKMVKNFHYAERLHYGVIDEENNSIIPNEDFLVSVGDGRLFDFVADSYSLAKLNCLAATNNGSIPPDSFLSGLNNVSSYSNPKLKYGRYLNDIFQYYNETHIPINLGTTSIASYEDYVKNFFNFFLNFNNFSHLTMTSWNVSFNSSLLDTGLAFSFYDLPYDEDKRKKDEIIDAPEFTYLKSLALNMGFNINNNNPNILVYDLDSPAGASIRSSYGLFDLKSLFNTRFIKTYTIDNDIIYNKLNLYYNKYAQKNTFNRVVKIHGCKTTSEYFTLENVQLNRRPYTDEQELNLYCQIRNKEEGNPYSVQKADNIYKK